MDHFDSQPQSGHLTRLRLSERGQSIEAAFRRAVSPTRGRILRRDDIAATLLWAGEHGLEARDGPYLVELASRPLTVEQLGEALAIHGQTREMIGVTVQRLVSKGLVHLGAFANPLRSLRAV
jgi:hypothetical protein